MIKRIPLLAGMFLLAAVGAKAQKISVTKGQKIASVTTSKMVMSMEMMGQNVDNNTASVTTTETEVKTVDDKGYLLGNTIKRMTVKASYMGQDLNFDSDKKEDMDGQMGQALKDKIGKTEEVKVDRKGKVVDTGSDTARAGGMSDMMSLSSQLVKGQPFPLMVQLPDRAVKTGDSWTDSTGSPETLKSVTTYTLKEIKDGNMLVSFTGTIAKTGTIQQNGMEIQLEMSGTMKGDAAYEMTSGWLKNNTTVSNIKGSFQVMGQSVPMTISLTASIAAQKL